MRVLWSVLSGFVDLSGLDPYDVAERLIDAGVEVEEVEDLREKLKNTRSAVISKIEPHPYTPNLVILNLYDGETSYKVVCSDKSLKEGDVVIHCRPQAVLPNGVLVSTCEIRGVESQGMLLSEIELGTDPDPSGVIVLDRTVKPGVDGASLVGFDDFVLTISPTPNRGDLFGVIGVAREISAIYGRELILPDLGYPVDEIDISEVTDVTVEDEEACPRYVAMYMYDVNVGPSPLWLKVKIINLGMRPINNVVDVTNYVMFEFGQPLHAFDFDRLSGGRIVVRRARPKEEIETLDGKVRVLDDSILVIADAEKPVAIAGVMGGANSEISLSTKRVLLESAYFDPVSIRRTSKKLELATEASKRFERGVDIEGLFNAALRAVHLISKVTGCKVAKGYIDRFSGSVKRRIISFDPGYVGRVLGCEVDSRDSERILRSLGFKVDVKDDGEWKVEVPSFRILDVTRPIDLVEEVARIWGYSNVPDELPSGELQKERPYSTYGFQMEVKRLFNSMGLKEVINFSFISHDFAEKLKLNGDGYIRILNPLSEDMSVMRPNLIFGLLECASRNHSNLIFDLAIYEVGRVFAYVDGRYDESLSLGFLLSGGREKHWSRFYEPFDFYDAKGIVETFFDRMGIGGVEFKAGSDKPYLHPKISCSWLYDGRVIAEVGELHPDVKERFDLKRNVYVGEILLEPFVNTKRIYKYRAYSPYPFVTRDLSFIVDSNISYSKIEEFIKSKSISYLVEFKLIDVFKGPQIGEDRVSYTISFVFSKMEGTLTGEEVDEVFWKLAEDIEKEFNAIIRARR